MVIPSRLDRPARSEPPPVATFERLTDDPAWVVRLAGFNPAGERAVETLLSVANGLVGTRGTLEETASASLPGVFVAGLFDPVHEALDPPADLTEAPALVNAPNWAALTLDVDGERITIETGDTLRHQRALDLRQALLLRDWRHRHPSGRITWVVTLRCAVGAERRALLQRAWIVPENYDAALTLLVTLDGRHAERVRTAAERWRTGAGEVALVSGRTPRSGLAVALAQSARLRHHGGEVAAKVDVTEAAARHRFDWRGEAGTTYRLDRIVAIATSRDGGDTAERAVRMAPAFARRGVDALLAAHRGAWAERWADADVRIQGDTAAQRAVRLAGYHLMAAANPEDERVSIGARGLSGPIYRGHVFWDTEIYMLPFFVFTWPAAARTLLMYRYHGLEAARAKARSLGYRGALYPWEAALSGHEATPRTLRDPEVARFYGVLGAAFYEETARTGERPGGSVPIRNGLLAPHTSADIAYAVRQYWQATGDDVFLARAGAEILLETARFWASRAVLEADGHYHIRGVIGPDEYHEEIDDSAYTNAMARLNLEFADEAARWLAEHDADRWRALAERLELDVAELERWRDVAERLVNAPDRRGDLIEQFAGYRDLEDLDLRAWEPRTAAMQVVLGRERIQRTQVIKQADVVLLAHHLWGRLDRTLVARCFAYYAPRCDHGSSLSPCIHALVAARLGRLDEARRYFDQAATIDLEGSLSNAALGIHIGAAGGLWQAVVFGAAGLELIEDGLAFAPHLLPGWEALEFPLRWRGHRLRVAIRASPGDTVVEVVEGPRGLWIRVNDDMRWLAPGASARFGATR